MQETILIVEDEEDVAEMIRYNLEKESYRTVVAYSGAEALKAAEAHAPDLVLLDILLPDLSGWEVCRILRDSTENHSIPIVMLTALSSEEARIKGLTLGADDFVTKPFSIKELLLRIRNMIDRQHALRRVLKKEKEKDLSLKYLVHELKNSVTVIGGFSALAIRKKDPENYLERIAAVAKHADSLLNDASLLSRLETSEGSLPMDSMDIGALIEEVVDSYGDLAKQRQIEIALTNQTSPKVLGNATAIRQVLINLISNALKFSRAGGTVWISVTEDAQGAHLKVKDQGCGIAPKDLPRIFDRFYRAAGSEHIKGAGLGLYIAKLLVEAMAGKLSVESTLGAGSTFTASLHPAPAMRHAFPSLSQEDARRKDTSPVRILR
ncbi:MAG: response regulator [Deltaproteobacteria bacterium]|jgi:signal transduction histidine kinase|nr:response regulator [Deltaproteobacteria bacterium]